MNEYDKLWYAFTMKTVSLPGGGKKPYYADKIAYLSCEGYCVNKYFSTIAYACMDKFFSLSRFELLTL